MANVTNIDVIDANAATVTVSTIDKTIGPAGTASTSVQTIQGIAAMTPVLVTLSGTNNLNNIAGTISLPTGAATAAKQPALGTAGSASTDVLSVQGITSMTPLLATLSGTNNIATVAAVTAISNALPAGTNLLGRISASVETNTVYNGTTALTPKFAAIQLSATGTVVAAVTSKKIRVLAYNFMANGSVNVKWQSHVTPTDLTGLKYLVVNTGLVAPFAPTGWFETVSGEALDLNLSASIAVGGELIYVEV